MQSYKSKYVIERQQSLLQKLHSENNILKNESSQLRCTNSKLITKLRSRLQPRMSPGNSVKGTHLVSQNEENYNDLDESPAILSPPTPGRPINSPIFPNLVQHNLDNSSKENSNVEPIASCLEGISQLKDQEIVNKSPRKTIEKKSMLFDTSGMTTKPGSEEKNRAPNTPKKSTPKKLYKPSPSKSKRKGVTPKKTKRVLQLPQSSPDVKRMKQLKMDQFSPRKEIQPQATGSSPRPKSPGRAQSPFKLPKSPKSRNIFNRFSNPFFHFQLGEK